jgi:hypothetical protein
MQQEGMADAAEGLGPADGPGQGSMLLCRCEGKVAVLAGQLRVWLNWTARLRGRRPAFAGRRPAASYARKSAIVPRSQSPPGARGCVTQPTPSRRPVHVARRSAWVCDCLREHQIDQSSADGKMGLAARPGSCTWLLETRRAWERGYEMGVE